MAAEKTNDADAKSAPSVPSLLPGEDITGSGRGWMRVDWGGYQR